MKHLKLVKSPKAASKVVLTFHGSRQRADRLDPEDLAAFVRCRSELKRANDNVNALMGYCQVKYSLSEGNRVQDDGEILRTLAKSPIVSEGGQ